MNAIIKYSICSIIGIMVGIVFTLWVQAMDRVSESKSNVVWRQNHYILNEENLFNELLAQGIDYPEIVLNQAILETGHFESYSCKVRNNLFGIRNKDGSYKTYDHWTFSVEAYKKYIQNYKSLPEDYYKYLEELGYAEDTLYITKLKQLNDTRTYSKF